MMDFVSPDQRTLLGVEAIAVDPRTVGRVYMVAGTSYWNNGRSAFLRSTNRGSTWEIVYTFDPDGAMGTRVNLFSANGNGMGRGNGEQLTVDPNNSNIMFYGSRRNGLFRSTNNGTTWTKVNGFTTAAGTDTTHNGSGFSFVTFAPRSSTTLYAGFLRPDNNVFQSTDSGTTWSVIPNRPKPATRGGYAPPLMPQRIAIAGDASVFYITFGDGAGPHTMRWDEGWGMIEDWFNRGAVLKYEVSARRWSDVSPVNLVDPGDSGPNYALPSTYVACYGGASINPTNPLEVIVSTIGYRWPQYWKSADGKWSEQWAGQVFYTKDGGANWVNSLEPFWIDGGYYPPVAQMNENGIGWMFDSSMHWTGSVIFDPFNVKRVFATSGNGVFGTDDITNFRDDPDNWDWSNNRPARIQETIWKVMSHGIEETVPMEVVSISGGPLVSVLLDYDGFRHNDITRYPTTRHKTDIAGFATGLGNTRALAYAYKGNVLVKASDSRRYQNQGRYMDVPHSPLQYSSNQGTSWTTQTYPSGGPGDEYGGAYSVAISTDGAATLLTPLNDQNVWRYANSAWSRVTGINGAFVVGDPDNANVFYAYVRTSGRFYRSTDKGVTFTEASNPGQSSYGKFRAIPDREGHLWLPLTGNGLVRSTDGGRTWTKVAAVVTCEAVGFGRAQTTGGYPTIFIFGRISTTATPFILMSTDQGAAWTRINDNSHQYGGPANGEFVMGDMNTFGRVYMSTAGRGIVVGSRA